jgi:diguanylate cyclase (GGDEF)-like protein/putative nucleotidyltransferase with HDIG domain
VNQKMPPSVVAFMVGTVVAAILAGLWGGINAGLPQAELPVFAVLGLLGALANLYPIRAAQTNVAVYVLTNTFLFAGVLLLSGGWLALLPVVIWVPNAVRRYQNKKPDWLLVAAANAGQALIISEAAHRALGSWAVAGKVGNRDLITLALVIAAVVLYQVAWVATVVHLLRRVPFLSMEFWSWGSLLSEAVLLCLGAVVAVLWRTNPLLLVLIVVPVVFAYHTLRGVQLIRLGEVDGKTGLYNARRFEEQFNHELTVATMLRRPLSVVFLDLDFLRDVNNHHGHLAGDAVIAEVARRIKDSIRQHDFAARFGGEEFVLLLPGTEVTEAHWLAEKVRQAVASAPIDIGGGKLIHCSISGGVAAYPLHGSTMPQLTAAADKALYQAKGQGRNRTCTAHERSGEGAVEPGSPGQPDEPKPVEAPAAQMPEAPAVSNAPAARQEPALENPTPTPDPLHENSVRWPLVFLGTAALVASVVLREVYHGTELLLMLCLLGFMAEYWKVDLLSTGQGRSTVSLGVAVTMAATVTLGLYAAVCVNVINFLAVVLQAKRRRLPTLAANLAIVALSAAAGSLPMLLLQGRSNGFDGWLVGSLLAGGFLYFFTNVGLVSWLAGRKQGKPVGALWRQHYTWMAPSYIFTAVYGGLMGSVYLSMGWMAFPAFSLPLLVVRHTYLTHMRRSREAYEAAERGRKALEEAHELQTASMEQWIELVSTIVDARDVSVSGHSAQVARYAVAIAMEMELAPAEVAVVRQAALLHDLGKMGIPEAILNKPGRLSPEEWTLMREHARIGERILQQVPGWQDVARMVGEHHEKWGGKGYPAGLAGADISLGARIIALADALDSILSDRPYSRARPLPWAIEEIERCSGEHFDPAVVAAFRKVVARYSPDFFINSAAGQPEDSWLQAAAAAMDA